jgi:hypothetical protein
VPDQWQVQVQARVQSRARVVVHTAGLGPQELAEAHLGHTDDVASTVLAALAEAGPAARVCVLPEGPQTIPYVPDGRRAAAAAGDVVELEIDGQLLGEA